MATRGWERDDQVAGHDGPTARTADANGSLSEAQDTGESVDPTTSATAPRKRRRNLLSEDKLTSAEGLRKIHRTFPYQVSSDVTGREAQALAQLMELYKQWAFDLFPGLNLEDFVDRAETLGKGHMVQGLMADLRDKERLKAYREEEDEEEKEGEEAML